MKKIFSLLAAVLMAGSMMADDATLIKFSEVQVATEVAGSTYGSEGFTLEIPATSDKATIDANSCTFGFSAEETVSFTHRLKTGGASSKDGRKFTLNIPEEGPLAIYARTSKAADTNRNFVIANGSDTIVNHICLDTDTVEGASSKIFLPVFVENVPAGSYTITYPVDGINFYGFELVTESAPESACDWDAIAAIGDGAQGGALTGKYKICIPDGAGINLVNIQTVAGVTGIYVTCGSAVGIGCSLGEGNFTIQGAGMWLHLSAFTAKETNFTISYDGNDYDCAVWFADGTEGEPTSNWDGTVTLSQTTFTSLADLEGLTLTFTDAVTVALAEEPAGVALQNEDGSEMYAIWSPDAEYGGTYTINGNTITLNNWAAGEALPTVSGSVYFEDYGTFAIDGEEDYFETVEAAFEAAPAVTYTVTYTVTGAVADEAAVQAGYFNEEETVGGSFEAGENTVPENMFAYVYVQMIEGYTVEVKVNDAAVTLNRGMWYSDAVITADMTIEVTFTAPEEEEENPYASIYTSNVTFTAGTNSYLTDKISIDGTEYDAFKIGTSKAAGNCSVTLPAGTTAFHFHAICWSKTADTDLNITGAYTETVVIKAANISGNSPYTFDLTYADPTERFYSHTFDAPLAAEATVNFACNYRAVFFGVNVVPNPTPTAVENVEAVKAVKVIENGQVVIIREGVRYNVAGLKL